MALTTFIYRDLESTNTIRLLKILPPEHDTENVKIACTVKHFREDDASKPEYHALSYHWGADPSATPARHIRIRYEDDQTFHEKGIQENLWGFLDQMRSLNRTEPYYWMDALCLNQDLKPEKEAQVPRMDEIYSEASRTISWLGRTDNLNDNQKHFIDKLPGWIDENRQKVEELLGSVPTDSYRIRSRSGLELSLKADKLSRKGDELPYKDVLRLLHAERIVVPMNDILGQPYWKRIWVIQEVALAKEVEILFGSMSFDFNDFLIAYKAWIAYFHISDRPAAVEARMLRSRMSFDDMVKPRMLMSRISFDDILQWGETCDSFQKLDKVYGLLGLLNRSQEAYYSRSLKADYNKPAAQLFWELVFVFGLYRKCRSGIPGELYENNRMRLRKLFRSLTKGFHLDGSGLMEFASSPCTAPDTHGNGQSLQEPPSICTKPEQDMHRALARVCMEAMPIYQAITELLGYNVTRRFFNTLFGYRDWIHKWGRQLPAYRHASDIAISKGDTLDDVRDASRLWMEYYHDDDPTGISASRWHCLGVQDRDTRMRSTTAVMRIDLYGGVRSLSEWESVKQRIFGFYIAGNGGTFQQDPGDEPDGERGQASHSLLVWHIEQLGWDLRFQPSRNVVENGEWEPDAEGKDTEGMTNFGELSVYEADGHDRSS